MTRQIIRTPDAPNSALFSQAIKVGSTISVSGLVGIDPGANQFFPTDPPARAVAKLR
jgi:2-iminobutanoate/2-iminopropanoate deaminase